MKDDEWEASLWTDAKRHAYVQASERAIAALREHVSLVASCSSEADEPRIDDSAQQLRAAYVALSQAEFAYSSTLAPFGLLETDEEMMEGMEEIPLDEEAEHNQVSILIRRDFAVTSEAEVLRAGRDAYLTVWPDDAPERAQSEVQHLGSALYEIMHAAGLDALNETPGLEPMAGVSLTVASEQLASDFGVETILESPEQFFTIDGGEILYSQSDVW